MGGSKMVGVLFADESRSGLTHAYFSGVLNGFKKAAEERGYDIAFLNCNKEGTERKTYIEQVRERKYEGIIIACIDFDDNEVKELLDSNIPIVTIDEDIENSICVKSDNVSGLESLVRYLIEMGHKRIAYITGDDNTVTKARVNSFLNTCKEMGVEIPKEYIKQSMYRDMRKAAFLTEELLRMPNIPSCIMYSDDYAAIGGINVIRARGMEIPGDISVTGFDGIDVLSQYEPRLTTVKQNTDEIGRVAANQLLDYIQSPEKGRKETVIVETSLEKGRTVGRCYF